MLVLTVSSAALCVHKPPEKNGEKSHCDVVRMIYVKRVDIRRNLVTISQVTINTRVLRCTTVDAIFALIAINFLSRNFRTHVSYGKIGYKFAFGQTEFGGRGTKKNESEILKRKH